MLVGAGDDDLACSLSGTDCLTADGNPLERRSKDVHSERVDETLATELGGLEDRRSVTS